MMTRSGYMDGVDHSNREAASRAHRVYYGQCVDEDVHRVVLVQVASADHLRRCLRGDGDTVADPHLNNIPLNRWDRATSWLPPRALARLKALGDIDSLAGRVCILKEAARLIVELKELKVGDRVKRLDADAPESIPAYRSMVGTIDSVSDNAEGTVRVIWDCDRGLVSGSALPTPVSRWSLKLETPPCL